MMRATGIRVLRHAATAPGSFGPGVAKPRLFVGRVGGISGMLEENGKSMSRSNSSNAASTIMDISGRFTTPQLVKVPSLPFVGSMLSWHSGVPPQDLTKQREQNLELKRLFGHFYQIGIPGLGLGTHGTIYMISDPREYMKIIRQEGKYPSGLLESLWPMQKSLQAIDAALIRGEDKGFFGRGVDWKRIRNFLQTDLLSPAAANGYLPGVIRAAELASKGAPTCSANNELNDYLNRCAFDMFSAVMFGELLEVADPNTPTDPINAEFVTHAARFVSGNVKSVFSLSDNIWNLAFNRPTKNVLDMAESAQKTMGITAAKIKAFAEKLEAGTLDDLQQQSYLAGAMKRMKEQSENDEPIDEEMFLNICWVMLTASVDTTSGVMGWALIHAALNPDMQDKLRQELKANLTEDGRLNPDIFTKRANLPYLHAFLRESHRVTPAIVVGMTKQVSEEIEIHGVTIPANQKFAFNLYSLQMDPAYVDNPHEFNPERWFPAAVEARKGTPPELIDHPFFKDPFSQGARKCPGSRVATNEVFCFLSQLILDYEIRCPGNDSYRDIPYTMAGVLTPRIPPLEFTPRAS